MIHAIEYRVVAEDVLSAEVHKDACTELVVVEL